MKPLLYNDFKNKYVPTEATGATTEGLCFLLFGAERHLRRTRFEWSPMA